ncbi:hypothetical protein [Streptomyces sp. NPDC101166]|uniref:hypothetical protein n=1 Tax=Streptomyces sp. NPDC101166 TaxID=3366120 RepID=UPI003823CC05
MMQDALFLAVYTLTFGLAAAFLYSAYRTRRRDEQTTARHARDGVRIAENYANNESVRTVVDGQQPPRKEKP